MFYACVRTFDVTGTAENFLGTKQGLKILKDFWQLHNIVEIKIALHKWIVNRETNLINLIRP